MPQAPINVNTAGDQTLIAAEAGVRFSVYKLLMLAQGQVDIVFKSGPNALTGVMTFGAGERIILDASDPEPWFYGNVGEAFIVNLSAAAQLSGTLIYRRIEARTV